MAQLNDFRFLAVMILCIAAKTATAQLPSVIDLNASPTNPHIVRVTPETTDQKFGSDLSNGIAFGDFNGDGYDDMAVGSPEFTYLSRIYCGTVSIVFGNATMSGKTLDLQSPSPQTAVITKFIGSATNEFLGASVAMGDFNRDGFDDLAVGAPLAEPNGRVQAGTVYIFKGGTSLVGNTIDLASGSPAGTLRLLGKQGSDIINEVGEEADYQMGSSLAVCDFNADSVNDLIIGAPLADPGGREDAGETIIIYGSTSLGSGDIDLAAAAGTHGETRILGDDPSDFLGFALAAGDYNGDGFDDLAVSSPDGNTTGGQAYVVFGASSLAGQALDLNSATDRQLTAQLTGGAPEDTLGFSIASGNINNDSYEDLLISARLASPQARSKAGIAYIFYGETLLANQQYLLSNPAGTYGETRIYGNNPEDVTGQSVSCADINGDGTDDVILGAPGADPSGGTDAGDMYVIYGINGSKLGASTLTGSVLSLNPNLSGVNVAVLGDNANDRFGFGGEAGADLDRNGFADFAASAFTNDHEDPELDDQSEYAVAVFGAGTATSAVHKLRIQDGPVVFKPFGGRLSPVMRAWIGFNAGNGSQGNMTDATLTLTRNKSAISNLFTHKPQNIAPVYWRIQINRVNFTTAQVRFQYLDSEIAGLDETRLKLYRSNSLAGPWNRPGTQSVDAARNTITANVTNFGYFAIVDAENDAAAQDWLNYR